MQIDTRLGWWSTALLLGIAAALGGCGAHVVAPTDGTAGTPAADAQTHGAHAPAMCVAPFKADTRPTTTLVGSGTAASCTELALEAALAKGGVIRFSCGGPATIHFSAELTPRTDVDTTIDGENAITFDGGGKTRLLHFDSNNFQHGKTVFTIQNLTLQNAASTGTRFPPAPAPCSQGYKEDAGGGAIFVKDGILHVIHSTFRNNRTATWGPDVGGGAIYALGSLETTVVDSTFDSNSGANGGAIGSLWGNLGVYGSRFVANQATGHGANYLSADCKVKDGESGEGGNGGAITIDGGENYSVNICLSTFTGNHSGVGGLGGAVFRTPDENMQNTTFDRDSFLDNAAEGGGALYFHNSYLIVTASTFAHNRASGGAGAVFADNSTLDFVNDTFVDNEAMSGVGGALFAPSHGGSLQNLTFLNNRSTGGSGFFAAAIGGGAKLEINNTLLAGNTTKDCGSPMSCQASKSTGTANLQWPNRHSSCDDPDKLCTEGTYFMDPNLGPLADNGGPTQTAAPLAGSPAIGLGENCPPVDQRGRPRPAKGCTLGAVEVAADQTPR